MNTETMKNTWYKSPLLLIWLFLVVMAMSGTIYMVIQANSGFSGLVVEDFYERGQNYEENIKTKLENNAKWLPIFKLSEAVLNQEVTIDFSLSGKDGQAAIIEKMTLFVYRPSNAKKDFNMPMTLLSDSETYQAKVTFPDKGKWDLLASAIIDGVEVNYPQKVFVKD